MVYYNSTTPLAHVDDVGVCLYIFSLLSIKNEKEEEEKKEKIHIRRSKNVCVKPMKKKMKSK